MLPVVAIDFCCPTREISSMEPIKDYFNKYFCNDFTNLINELKNRPLFLIM